jgi:hypothetical protein
MIAACQRRMGLTIAGCVLATLGLTATPAAAKGAGKKLPEAAKTAIAKSFAGATIRKVERQRENGVVYYEVEILLNRQEIEVEVAPDGALGEVTQELKQADLPADVAARIAALVGAGKLKEIERTEVRGVPQGTTFAPQTPAKVVYEVKYTDAITKKTAEARLGADGAVIAGDEDDDDDDGDHNGDDGGDEHDDGEGNHQHGHQDKK